MIYADSQAYLTAPAKRVLLFGMSGLGKTHVSNILRDSGNWFHYSVDYRIGTRYMGEYISDMFKREAMKNPVLRALLMSDSVYISSNITFDNLAPLSTYLGKPGDPAKGGVEFAEYQRRQAQHLTAEVAAMLDTTRFIDRAKDILANLEEAELTPEGRVKSSSRQRAERAKLQALPPTPQMDLFQ